MRLGLILVLAALSGSGPAAAAWSEALSPWSVGRRDYSDWTLPRPPRRRYAWERLAVKDTPPPQTIAPAALLGEDMLWLYQHTLSGDTGSRCPHYPSCSRYSRIAVDTYGLLIGVIMTADRLERCHVNANDVGQYPWRNIHGDILIWDPPSMDAWWSGGRS